MKKSRIFMASGTLALAIAAVFATKANKKFAFGLKTAVGGDVTYASATAIFTVSHGGTLVQAYGALVTLNGSRISPSIELFTKTNEAKPLYMAP